MNILICEDNHDVRQLRHPRYVRHYLVFINDLQRAILLISKKFLMYVARFETYRVYFMLCENLICPNINVFVFGSLNMWKA